jgi:porin
MAAMLELMAALVRAAAAIFFVVAAAGAQTPPSIAAQQVEGQDYEFHSPHPSKPPGDFTQNLLGDWRGFRSRLADHGVRLAALFIGDPFGNVSGGVRRGAANYNLAVFGIVLHTDQLLGWTGGQFHVGFADNFGTSLSREYVGNAFPIQLADVADAHPRLTYLSYTQSLWQDRLSIRLGRLTINSVSSEEFLGSQYFKAFTSVGIDLVPLGPFLNAPGAFGYPDTTWGARVKFAPVKRFYTMAGAYNGDPRLKQGALHGVDFSLRGPVFVIGEIGVRWNFEKNSPRLAGNLKAGGYYNGGSARAFATAPAPQSETERGRSGFYVVADQALLRWGDSTQDRHLGAFGGFTAAPDQRVNRVPYFFDTGMVAYGPSSKRPRDLIGFAVVYGSYSRDLRLAEEINPEPAGVQNLEMTAELNYGWVVRPGLLLQPDLQYVVHPNGNTRLHNALAIGINIVVNL